MRRISNLTSLRLFMRVAYDRSFSEAGRGENLSQPALSRTIRLLEEELGVRLFDRTNRTVSLTGAGEALLPIVERLTADFDHAFSELALSFSGERGRIVIGALPSIAIGMLPGAVASFLQRYPHVELTVRDYPSHALFQLLQDRQIDLAITSRIDDPAFAFELLSEDRFMLMALRGGRLDAPGAVDWAVFADHPFIAMEPRSSMREVTDASMIRAGVAVKPLFECSQLGTLGGFIEAGLGITALPQSTLGVMPSSTICRPLRNPTVFGQVGIAYRLDRTLPPAAANFVRHLVLRAKSEELWSARFRVPAEMLEE